MIEVLSPRPRIGSLEERITWFAQYGVKEIWLYHQSERQLHVMGCDGTDVAWRANFSADAPVVSGVVPDFRRSMGSIIDRV